MKKNLHYSPFKSVLLTLFIIFYATSFVKAQETQITLTGYTEDVIADAVLNTDPTAVTTAPVDIITGNVFYAQGYSPTATPLTNGLPTNGQFTSSAGHNFQLAPYNSNNDLRLEALQSGTLTFDLSDQIAYTDLYILGSGGGGSPDVSYTINFTDATTTTGLFTADDWFCNNCTPFAIKDLGRADRTDGSLQGILFAIREYTITLSVPDQAKQISSIDFSVAAGESGVANIFGITGAPAILLPITLEYFSARAENGQAMLQWKTSQELNNKKFIVERATNAQPSIFVSVGEIQAISSQNGTLYNFTNVPPAPGTYLYRLTQEDIDGRRKIIGTKSITINSKTRWVVQDLGSQWKLICDQPFTYRLLDMNGRVLKASTGSGSATIFKPSSHGIYQIQVQTGGESLTQKLLK